MKTPDEIKAIIDNHTQMREHSCFQSAVEMALKLYGIIDAESYPEQAIVENDGKGFEPFKGTKTYGATTVSFTETKYEPISDNATQEAKALFAKNIYPVFSFRWPVGSFHGFVGYTSPNGDLAFITKNSLGKGYTDIWPQSKIWPHQAKTEILTVRIV